ncbi:hypothetical protein CH306_17565 [Rhodococcus sp. 15-725-2-2b]|uniref:hypothetical protein n=1 Tax=unclassified Rhodococcus (in: high G+C Gram-positive bacteria) TaxID=192944 RepID=UPI000B9A2DF3|nr:MULTISPECIES: hypothetical protein [unclassified Rhodococcus (in: high G+C Gram-positive bacteria)]OZC62008.1 hypothetical protein CH276_15490 [Rhodococcus sp. 06-470-2]OZC64494.1 hypothetical protein CH277_17470 [Rhodococcus sp. 06-469-3-2]OZD51127.1 hypothetical protein CH264_02105 [Rhodococcus sp. 06-1477-1A]OZE58138.1 hypothetical protein CH265_23080 [Rhodococcus sp. 05-2221-1B]OZE71566.1 hypothetical protein CH306_17565 [Rhodococcus sp. 15-725-2-2b]
MSANESERACEQAIRERFPVLDKMRAASAMFTPAKSSELHLDDEDWIPHPLSQSAYQAFTAALDHLQAIRVHLDVPKPVLFPYAHLSLCRPALVAASLAVWLLNPAERQERIERHRISIADELRNHARYLSELTHLDPSHENTAAVLAHVRLRLSEINTKLGVTSKKSWDKLRVSTTDQIGVAADALAESLVASKRSADDPRQLANEIKLSWQATSGAAHGLTWQINGTPSIEQAGEADEYGRALFTAGGSFGQLANHYCSAIEMARLSWDLLKQRGGR